jgi:IS30 family transposase
MVIERTLYKYIDDQILPVRNIDLPRKVRYKPRKRIKMGYKVDTKYLKGKTYEDYLEFINTNKYISIVQIDTVESRKGGKFLLTIHFIDTSFMLMFLRDSNDSKSVTEWFKWIYHAVGEEYFKKLFPVILTDYGNVFSDPRKIEIIDGEEKLTNIFYCYPYSAFLKPEIENNHELVRRIIPKGKKLR